MIKISLYSRKNIVMTIVLLLIIISTVSYTLSITSDANHQVKQDINDFSRGTYDILLRPGNAHSKIEADLNIIEENYLGNGFGGISLAEWNKVKSHPNVELAAPVASIGLFTSQSRTWMFEREINNSDYYEVSYSTTDGVNEYLYNEDISIYNLYDRKTDELMWYPSSSDVSSMYMGLEIASFDFPPSYHQVVAVDPTEEGKLTNYNLNPLNEAYIVDHNSFGDGNYSIPIMSLADVTPPNTILLSIDELTEPTEKQKESWNSRFIEGNPVITLEENPDLYQNIIQDHMSIIRKHNDNTYVISPDLNQSPFNQNLLYLDEKMNLKSDQGEGLLGGVSSFHSQRIGYRLDPVKYDVIDENHLSVNQVGKADLYDAPIYRDVQEIEFYQLDEFGQPTNPEEMFEFFEIDTFSIKENTDSLASSPLGIYGRNNPYMASNSSQELHPSAVPGSFITTPAHGLISINWAEQLKGDYPIDAIRVKIANLKGYDQHAANLIRTVALEWENAGFTVDIVAGASLQEMNVTVEGIGDIIQSFTSLGAADTFITSWNVMQIVLTILYGLVAFTFICFHFFNLLLDRRKDEELLAKLGWPKKLIRNLRTKEFSIMLGTPIILVLCFFILYSLITNQWFSFICASVCSALIILLYFLIHWILTFSLKSKPLRGKLITTRNLWYYKYHFLASSIQLFLLTVLTCFLPFYLVESVKNTNQTKLGSYIHSEIEGIFMIIILLLYALSLTTVYQSFSRIWINRRKEFELFQYVGWDRKTIRSYYLKEVLLLGSTTTLIGYSISIFLILLLINIEPIFFILAGLSAVAVMVLIILAWNYSFFKLLKKGGKTVAD